MRECRVRPPPGGQATARRLLAGVYLCPGVPKRYPSHVQCGGAKSFVDDLGLSRGVVLSRAAASLRSVETKPFDWQICPLGRTHLLMLFFWGPGRWRL